jgi:predicted RNA-binding Zn-ribbon protein involved in translation (DUF1610 family)
MEIQINNEIQKKAESIIADKKAQIQQKKDKSKYIDTCVEADICPVCGDKLIKRSATKEEKDQYGYDYYHNTLTCNKNHFLRVNGDFDDYDYD